MRGLEHVVDQALRDVVLLCQLALRDALCHAETDRFDITGAQLSRCHARSMQSHEGRNAVVHRRPGLTTQGLTDDSRRHAVGGGKGVDRLAARRVALAKLCNFRGGEFGVRTADFSDRGDGTTCVDMHLAQQDQANRSSGHTVLSGECHDGDIGILRVARSDHDGLRVADLHSGGLATEPRSRGQQGGLQEPQAPAHGAITPVIPISPWTEVIGTDARGRVAGMKNVHAPWDRSVEGLVHDSVSRFISMCLTSGTLNGQRELTVTARTAATDPDPALVGFVDLLPEPGIQRRNRNYASQGGDVDVAH